MDSAGVAFSVMVCYPETAQSRELVAVTTKSQARRANRWKMVLSRHVAALIVRAAEAWILVSVL